MTGDSHADGVEVRRDVVFARPAGHRPLELDLYLPAIPAQVLCVYLHGGGWRLGSRRDGPQPDAAWSPSFFHTVAALGLAVASVDYRLSTEATFPAQLHDVTAAVRHLTDHRREHGLQPGRTVAWGVSAGGHLAAMYALTAGAAPVDAVACWYPPTDLGALPDDIDEAGGHSNRGPDARESQLIGAPLRDRPDLAAAASPVHRVRPGAPPFLFLHGTADLAVPARQSRRLADALGSAGAHATVDLVEGAGHMFPELGEQALRALVTRTVRFLLDPPRRTPES